MEQQIAQLRQERVVCVRLRSRGDSRGADDACDRVYFAPEPRLEWCVGSCGATRCAAAFERWPFAWIVSGNANAIARYLLVHPLVKAVHYPGLPAQAAINVWLPKGLKGRWRVELRGRLGVDPADVLNNLHLFRLAVSLGAVESLAELPCRMTHFELPRERLKIGITDELVRLAVGIEDANDLIEDLEYGAFDIAYAVTSIGMRLRRVQQLTSGCLRSLILFCYFLLIGSGVGCATGAAFLCSGSASAGRAVGVADWGG